MTHKETYLHHLHQARVEHTRWVGMIKLLSAGLLDTHKQEDIELNMSDIDFGKWLEQEAMLFRDNTCVDTLYEIEALWKSIHNNFMQIYEVCVSKNKSSLFGRKKPLSDGAIQISAVHYQEIITLSDKLKQKLRLLEKQLNAKGEDEFETYGNYLIAKEHEVNLKIAEKSKKEKSKNVVSGARGAYVSE
ncbi:hypothetical protein TSL6_11150 [Sulfurovum sp. TSL6]|uniref:hypothetical protein n=1 Tax=Sulfurovum sp. TSL6 TaxID=2826995 RepID=UPI001CC3888B|nr:hypothetical protein [Sulfurovum sp. TSL6]GIU00609.1 hypothetical protein TSL6_11150 [Sulfurovum sp. TSL6]